MPTLIKRLYDPKYMIKDELRLGEIPNTKLAYSVAFATAWAAIIETFFMALIGMSDTIMVSGISSIAIAAVGIVSQPRYLAQTLIFALNAAVTAICARRKGEGDQKGAATCLKQSLVLSSIISVVVTVVFLPFSKNMVEFMGAEPDVVVEAVKYLNITLISLPLGNLCHTVSSAYRGVGDTKTSMTINIIINTVDITFNYILINGIWIFPRLEVSGAALGTTVGWSAGIIYAIYAISSSKKYLSVRGAGSWKPSKEILKTIGKVSSGSLLEFVCLRLGFMSYAKIVAGLGTVMYTAHEILMNLMSLSFSFGDGFGISASSLVGQNLGAKRPDLSIIYGKSCQRMSLISSFVLSAVFIFAGNNIVGIFTQNPEILTVSRTLLIIMSLIVFAQSSQMVFMGALRGAGDTRYTAVISMVSIMLVRPIVGYIFAYNLGMGLIGAWVGLIIDQFVRLYLTHRRFSSGKWAEIRL